MAGNEIQNLLRSGIEAARGGNKAVARGIFEQVIKLDSRNEAAWLWLASVLETPADRRRALQQVLSINPNNERAQQALAKLGSQQAPASASTPPPPVTALSTATAPRQQPIERNPRRGGLNPVVFAGGIILALAIIGIALALLFLDSSSDDQAEATAVGIQVVNTSIPPSATPFPVRTVVSLAEVNQPAPRATWTTQPTATITPTSTATAPPLDLSIFTLIYAGAEDPAARARLNLIQADGTGHHILNIQLDSQVAVIALPTLTAMPSNINDLNLEEPESEQTAEAIEEDATEEEAVEESQPVPFDFEGIEFFDPAFSPDGEWVAFSVQIAPDTQELFIYHFETIAIRQLTRLGARNLQSAAWSPDGSQIAFTANRSVTAASPDFKLYSVNVADEQVNSLLDGVGQVRDVTWSPDGTRLVFSSDRATPGELEIWAFSFGVDSVPQQLTNDVNASFSPAYSHDGTRIAFISNRNGDNDLFVMNADGTDERLITGNDNNADDREPAWSPDDEWIVVSSNREGLRAYRLWAVTPDGRNWTMITQTEGADRAPDWRPMASAVPISPISPVSPDAEITPETLETEENDS